VTIEDHIRQLRAHAATARRLAAGLLNSRDRSRLLASAEELEEKAREMEWQQVRKA
jgi:hypothetical protein